MRVLIINEVCGHGSTGKICADLAEDYAAKGNEVRIAYGRDSYVPEHCRKFAIRIGNDWDVRMHAVRTRLLDEHGFGSVHATKKFLRWVDEYQPDLVWLHNLHGYYINIELLFEWIKQHPELEVKWTLHDCWAFTGHCSHFMAVGCDLWKTHCSHCCQKGEYPKSIGLDRSANNYARKKASFTNVKNMTIITPSEWLEKMVKQSFLKEYPVEVVHNTIDDSVFKPTPSQFREKYHLEDKIVLLGVANIWNEKKGLLDFLDLCYMLDDRYAIVLVGMTKKQITDIQNRLTGSEKTISENDVTIYRPHYAVHLSDEAEKNIKVNDRTGVGCVVEPDVIKLCQKITGRQVITNSDTMSVHQLICMPRTKTVEDLVKLYTMADLFVNPTHEDNYPTVNLEARACGTYVIAYDVGGTAETLS